MRLNVKLNADGHADALKKASAAKAGANETMDEAWARIFAQKNSESDLRKLQAVKAAFEAGKIGREPVANGKKPKRFSKAEALRLYAQLAERERESKLAELVEKTPENYRLVLSLEELRKVADVPYNIVNEPVIAVDTETTGLDVYVDVIVGVSITRPGENLHYYIPFKPTKDERALPAEYLQELKALIESEKIGKVLHNALYDMAMFERHGITLNNVVWDTMTAMQMLNENEMSYQLKKLATKYLAEPSDTFEELFGKNAQFADVPLDVALVYAAKDTDLTWRLYQFQLHHLSKTPTILDYYKRVEVPLMYAVYDMERTGFEIDTEYAKEYGKEMKAEIDQLERELVDQLGGININSNQQLKPALESIIGETLPNLDAKKTLKPLKNKHAIIATLLHYRELNKLYSTYISVLPEKIHPVTGHLHTRFNPNGTVTGRFSSGGNGINLQNQPYAARKLFIAPEGHVIIGADWSQQEVRCAAYFTQEPVLVNAYQSGKDVYTAMAADFYNKPESECGDGTPERKAMKVGVLSALYGTGPSTLAVQLGCTVDEAKAFLAEFFRKLQKVDTWIKETQAYADKHGYVWMDKQQRKRRLPDAKLKARGWGDPKRKDKMRALRQSSNAVIQGTSAIQSKTTIVELHKLCKRKGWRLWSQCHDEAFVLVNDTITREELAELESVMLNSYVFGDIPNKTDIEFYKRWGEGISVDDWFKQNGN